MRAVMLEADETYLEQRRRLGHDRFDEIWEGVLHMVPPPSGDHQALGSNMHGFLKPLARRRGLRLAYEMGFFAAEDDYRQPDLVVYTEAQRSRRGVDFQAELVVEIRSPHDEVPQKLPWYGQRAKETLVLDPLTFAVALYRGPDVTPVPDGHSEVLGVTFTQTPHGVHLRWDDGEATVHPDDL